LEIIYKVTLNVKTSIFELENIILNLISLPQAPAGNRKLIFEAVIIKTVIV